MGRTEAGFEQLAADAGLGLGVGSVSGLTSRGPWAHGLDAVPTDVVGVLRAIHSELGGDERLTKSKSERPLRPDFLMPNGQIVEVDEIQHFTSDRVRSLAMYPAGASLGFDLGTYVGLCDRHRSSADRYRAAKTASDFPSAGGRRAQRAFFDAARDLLAPYLTGHPVVRAAAPECDPGLAFARVREDLRLGGGA